MTHIDCILSRATFAFWLHFCSKTLYVFCCNCLVTQLLFANAYLIHINIIFLYSPRAFQLPSWRELGLGKAPKARVQLVACELINVSSALSSSQSSRSLHFTHSSQVCSLSWRSGVSTLYIYPHVMTRYNGHAMLSLHITPSFLLTKTPCPCFSQKRP